LFTESGLLVFKLIDGEFSHTGAYVDVLMDDMAYSSYSTAKIKSRSMTFNESKMIHFAVLRSLLTTV
jgi:Ca2+-dependent lipid-binding protein